MWCHYYREAFQLFVFWKQSFVCWIIWQRWGWVKYSTVQDSLILQSVLIKTWPKPVTRARKICGAQGSLAVAASRELSGIREEWKPTGIHSRIAELPVLHFSNQDFSDSHQCWMQSVIYERLYFLLFRRTSFFWRLAMQCISFMSRYLTRWELVWKTLD